MTYMNGAKLNRFPPHFPCKVSLRYSFVFLCFSFVTLRVK